MFMVLSGLEITNHIEQDALLSATEPLQPELEPILPATELGAYKKQHKSSRNNFTPADTNEDSTWLGKFTTM